MGPSGEPAGGQDGKPLLPRIVASVTIAAFACLTLLIIYYAFLASLRNPLFLVPLAIFIAAFAYVFLIRPKRAG